MSERYLAARAALRARAEKMAAEAGELQVSSEGEVRSVLHELQVHQIELELSNEELRRLQEESEQGRSKFAHLFHEAPVGYVVLDEAGIIRMTNRRFERMLDAAEGSLVGTPLARQVSTPDDRAFLGRYGAFFRSPAGKQIDVRLQRTGGRAFDARITAQRSPDMPGLNETRGDPATRILAMITDVSREKESQRRLVDSERIQSLVLNASTEFFAYYDSDLRIRWVNQAAGAHMGQSEKALIGRHCYEAWHGHEGPCQDCPALVTKRELRAAQAERTMPDGAIWRMRTFPVLDETGQLVAITEHGQDISAERLAERQRRTLEEQLQQAQKMEAVGRLAGGIAHDFNNLLTTISGNVELAQLESRGGSPVGEFLGDISAAARRAAELTGRLLTFSRKRPMTLRVLVLPQIVLGVQRMVERLLGEDIAVETEHAVPDLRVHGDLPQLEQVLLNLVINARDAMPKGGRMRIATGRVGVPTVRDADAGEEAPFAFLEVTDTGHGMDEATRARVFEPFFTTKPIDEGTGLGLSVVYSIVQQHGGRIEVASVLGEGTTLRVLLPITEEEGEEPLARAPRGELPKGTERILVVEDEDGVRAATIRMLSRLGYDVEAAASGEEALAILEDRGARFDLVVSDVIMQGIDGAVLSARIAERYPAIKVLLVSGYSDDKLARAEGTGVQRPLLPKPYTMEALAQGVRAALKQV